MACGLAASAARKLRTGAPIDWRSLLHRYVWHVGREEGATFIPHLACDVDHFTAEEIAALEALDQERPADPGPQGR
jgi:hypothetical protein